MNTSTALAHSTDHLRAIATDLERPAAERETARAELRSRIADIHQRIDYASDCIRNAMKNDAPDAEQYHRNLRDALNAELDRALGF